MPQPPRRPYAKTYTYDRLAAPFPYDNTTTDGPASPTTVDTSCTASATSPHHIDDDDDDNNNNNKMKMRLALPTKPNGDSTTSPLKPLLFALPLLIILSAIEMAFVSSMVAFLHGRANGFWMVNYPGGSSPSGDGVIELAGKPSVLLEDQGHTSNGVAGTGVVLVGVGGLLMVWWERRRMAKKQTTKPGKLFDAWLVVTILGTLLCLAALIYTFVLTERHEGQSIDLAVVARNQAPRPYPLEEWTPENWFAAVAGLDLADEGDRGVLRRELRLMRGWRWNLVPLFLCWVGVSVVGCWEWWRLRRGERIAGTVVEKGTQVSA